MREGLRCRQLIWKRQARDGEGEREKRQEEGRPAHRFTELADTVPSSQAVKNHAYLSAAASLGSALSQECWGPPPETVPRRERGGWIYLLASLPSPFHLGEAVSQEVPTLPHS